MTSSDVNFNIDNTTSKNYIDRYSGCNGVFNKIKVKLVKINDNA